MTFATMERNWTQVGRDHNGTDEQKTILGGMFDRLEWQEIFPAGITLPMMPGEGLKEAIRELGLPKVSHVAISNEMAPYGLMAARAHYKNGTANVYLADEGSRLVVLCSDFYPKDEEEKTDADL